MDSVIFASQIQILQPTWNLLNYFPLILKLLECTVKLIVNNLSTS